MVTMSSSNHHLVASEGEASMEMDSDDADFDANNNDADGDEQGYEDGGSDEKHVQLVENEENQLPVRDVSCLIGHSFRA